MAYNASNEVKEELVKIQKNNRGDYVIASKITNKNSGTVSIDIRQFYTNDNDEVMPTSKGVRLNAESLLELLSGLARALEANEVMDLCDTLQDSLQDLEEGLDDSDMPEE